MGKRPNQRLSTILRGAQIPSTRDIAQAVSNSDYESTFEEAFALAVVQARITFSRGAGVDFRDATKFPFGLRFERKEYVVDVAYGKIYHDLRSHGLKKYGRDVRNRIERECFNPEGVVCFLSFNIHGKNTRNRFPKNPPFTLVDIGYDRSSIDALAREYV